MESKRFKRGRREFLQSAAVAGAAIALGQSREAYGAEEPMKKRNIKLGFDNFSIRGMGWNASQLLDYAGEQKVDTILLSNLGVYESFEDEYLKSLKEKADSLGVEVHAGTNSICPTSNAWSDKYGNAQEHLALCFNVAKALGSAVVRCYLGNRGDREGDGGIYPHIEKTVEVCKSVKSQALDLGVKIAIENHAGDMQAWELAELIEAAGKDTVGATLDAGNATWTIEDPLASLKILGPYAVSTGIRDSAVWETEKGASVAWTAMGDGSVDWNVYLDRFEELCPGVSFQLEIIATGPREFNYLEEEFWKTYPRGRGADLARFIALAKTGAPAATPPDRPTGDGEEAQKLQQTYDLERSLEYCREKLGLGLKA
jgi:sugar phosphate isomerase/epimerase